MMGRMVDSNEWNDDELSPDLRDAVAAVLQEPIPVLGEVQLQRFLPRSESSLVTATKNSTRRAVLAAGILIISIAVPAVFIWKPTQSLAFAQAIEKLSAPQAMSYVETTVVKEGRHEYSNKVFLAADGRKRTESLTTRNPLISIFDDWGIQRIYLRPRTKTATVFAALEEFQGDSSRLVSWIENLKGLEEIAEKILENRIIDEVDTSGFVAKKGDTTYTVWVDRNQVIRQVEINSPESLCVLTQFRTYETLEDDLFSFDPPPGYEVAERH